MNRRILIAVSAILLLMLTALFLGGAIAAEGALHPPRQILPGAWYVGNVPAGPSLSFSIQP